MGLASLESDRKWKDLSVSTDYRSAVALAGVKQRALSILEQRRR
jgi:hypothetical protein